MSHVLLLAAMAWNGAIASMTDEDPNLWLEEVEGEEALDWVREQNGVSMEALGSDPGFEAMKDRLLAIYDSDDRIPYVTKRGDWYYNFWRDGEHPRGLWRRTSFESWKSDDTDWEVLIDLDALAEEEGENWVWHGSTCLRPEYERCLISLSRGGADADVTREYDIAQAGFVEGGFERPEAKGSLRWIDRDNVYVATDFGEGSLTESGYPRIVKQWTRGTPLEDAVVVHEGTAKDISVGAYHDSTPGYERDFVYQGLTFYTNKEFQRTKKGLVEVFKPDHADMSLHRDWMTLELRKDWELDGVTYKAGSLLATDFDKWMRGKRKLTVLFEPTETTSLAGHTWTKNHLLMNVLDDVRNKLYVLTPGKKEWTTEQVQGLPEFGSVDAWAVDSDESDAYWLNVSDYLTPASLAHGEIGSGEPEILKSLPTFFDAEGLVVSQHFATSEDGTRVPYFQVSREEIADDAPTLLYGYGGFEVSLLPGYNAGVGVTWLEKGGVYVVANIRGGGEYGPRWHQAALRENRHRAYEDFAAVARDLVERGVTTPDRLGAMGGSNGGLLMGNMYTLYPDDFGAIVCRVPLLDMKRYTKLLAGASWAGEYGDPDVAEDWAFIQSFSPYHNIDAEADYPPMLLMTSTRDDRVHPGHARKMFAALKELDKDVLYYENIEGGHGGAANNEQAARMSSLAWTFLWQRLTGEAEEAAAEAPEESEAPE